MITLFPNLKICMGFNNKGYFNNTEFVWIESMFATTPVQRHVAIERDYKIIAPAPLLSELLQELGENYEYRYYAEDSIDKEHGWHCYDTINQFKIISDSLESSAASMLVLRDMN